MEKTLPSGTGLDRGQLTLYFLPVERTFPVSRKEIARRRREAVLGSVLTWVAPLPVFGAWAFLGIPAWVAGALLVGVGYGLYRFWKKELAQKESEWMAELVAQSNADQDRLLVKKAEAFSSSGDRKEADVLRRVITLKQRIEAEVHGSHASSAQKEKLDTLVDTVSFSLVKKLENHAAGAEMGSWGEVEVALEILSKTLKDLPVILNPANGLMPEAKDDSFERAMRELKEETDLARRVKERLQNDLGNTTTSGSAVVES